MKEKAIIEPSSQLPQSSNSLKNNEVSLIALDQLPAFRMLSESSVNKYFLYFLETEIQMDCFRFPEAYFCFGRRDFSDINW